jgi:hypothetical protein
MGYKAQTYWKFSVFTGEEMNQVKIIRTTGIDDCESCGTSYSEGYEVYINDKLAHELVPLAHCYGGATYEIEDAFKLLLQGLGYDVIIEY